MRIGILSDTHDQLATARLAIDVLRSEHAEAIVHCGDICGNEVIAACSALPLYFAFGNHDCDMVRVLETAALEYGATCLRWGGLFTLAGRRMAVAHGHLTMDLKPLLASEPDFLFSGHSHIAGNWQSGRTRRINPGALFDASVFSVAMLDLASDEVRFIPIPGGKIARGTSRNEIA